MTPTAATNLAAEAPRPMDATIGGYTWLPRMIDKARAAKAGTLGDYYRYPCPIDRTCLDKLGIDADTFAEIAATAAADQDVILAIQSLGARAADEAWFDPVRLNQQLHSDAS
jgi:hypothetical protein